MSGGAGSTNFTGWTSAFNQDNVTFQKVNFAVSGSTTRFRGTNASVSALVKDTWAQSGSTTSSNASILIDTYGTTSTNLVENFDDENRRQDSGYNSGATSGNWNSATALTNGQAMVLGGQLIVPNQATLTSGASNSNFSSFQPDDGGANPNYSALTFPANYL